MGDDWIKVAHIGNNWSYTAVYVNKNEEIAKLLKCETTHWGYHDESECDESEEIISIERALQIVFPNENAISLILNNTKNCYSKTLEEISKKYNDYLVEIQRYKLKSNLSRAEIPWIIDVLKENDVEFVYFRLTNDDEFLFLQFDNEKYFFNCLENTRTRIDEFKVLCVWENKKVSFTFNFRKQEVLVQGENQYNWDFLLKKLRGFQHKIIGF